ncbi:hypothetical protein WME94_19960 [Sorangium sp. So ce429]
MVLSTKLSGEELLRRLQAGEDLSAIARSLVPPAEREMLHRCSLVRRFDADLFTILCEGAAEPASFDGVLQSGDVEPVPGSAGTHRVRESKRAEHLRDLFGSFAAPRAGAALPDAVLAIERRLIAHHERRDEAGRTDLLYHLALVDPRRASDLFVELYNEADRAFDLARCYDLLKIVDEGQTLRSGGAPLVAPDPELDALRADRSYYLDARSHWADEFYATGRFFERRAQRDAIEALLASPARWILQVHARGGMGKTMLLRWAIARRCVPAPARIACALVDFDDVCRAAVTREPWQLLLAFAEQLDAQLPGAPFTSLVLGGSEYRDTRAMGRGDGGAFGRWVVDQFSAALRDTQGDRPVLLILDTCEEALLRQGTDLGALLDHLLALHEACPAIRVLLSGRYDLRDRLPAFCERVGPALASLSIEPFSDDEARRYLTERRALPPDDRVAAVIARAGGVPFKLALLGDVLQANTQLSAAEILAYPRADLIYLIERVVERIEDPQVQWLLRYGVVPRRLSFAFLRDVMARYLPAATAGNASYDDPQRDLPEALRQKGVFRAGPEVALPEQPSEAALRALWQRLTQYESSASWVSAAGDAVDTLTFHPDVLNPMRLLLRGHEVFRLLHEAALAHFERMAEADAAQRGRWMREAVYHAFQLHGEGASGYWEAELDRASRADDAAWCLEVAGEVVGSEYVDEDGAPLRIERDRWLVAPKTQFRAHYEMARAAIDLARASDDPDSHLWDQAERSFFRAARARFEVGRDIVPRARMAVARAQLELHRGDPAAACAHLEEALPLAEGAADQFAIHLAWADALAALGRPEAVERARLAVALAAKLPALPPRLRVDAHERLARARMAFDRHDGAAAACRAAVEIARSERPRDVARLALLSAEILLEGGQLGRACDALPAPAPTGWPLVETVQRALLEATCARQLGDLEEASLRCVSGLELLRGVRGQRRLGPASYFRLLSRGTEVLGTIHGDALDLDRARNLLLEAAKTALEAGDLEATVRCRTRAATLCFREEGDLASAERVLELGGSEEAYLLPGSEARAELEIARAEVLLGRGATEEAASRLDALLVDLRPEWPPRVRVRLALASLATRPPSPAPRQRLLASALGDIESEPARLESLEPIERCPSLNAAIPTLVLRLEELLAWRAEAPEPGEAIRWSLRRADVLRVLGRVEEAQAALAEARTEVLAGGRLVHLRALLRAFDRLGAVSAWPSFSRAFTSPLRPHEPFLRRAPPFGALAAVIALEQAERLRRTGRARATRDAVEEAERLLGNAAPPASWRERLDALRAPATAEQGTPKNVLGTLGEPYLERTAIELAPPDSSRASASSLESAPSSPSGAARSSSRPALHLSLHGMPDGHLLVRERGLRYADRTVALPFTSRLNVASPSVLGAFFDDWGGASLDMGQALFPRPSDVESPGSAFLVRLEIDPRDPGLAALPWELGRAPDQGHATPIALHTRIRHIFRAKGAGKSSLAPSHSRRTALVLQPAANHELRTYRGRHRGNLAKMYEASGFKVEVLEEPGLERLEAALRNLRPAVIHVRAAFRAPPFGGLHLDFARQWRERFVESVPDTSSALTPSELCSLKGFSRRPAPLLVLDPYRPPGRTELIRQLLIRNAFASEVRARQGAPHVIAAGLYEDDEWDRVSGALLGSLVSGRSLGGIVAVMRRAAWRDAPEPPGDDAIIEKEVSALGVALFTDNPQQALL